MSLSLGPLLLSLPRLFFVLGILAASFVAWRMNRRYSQSRIEPMLWLTLGLGLLAARLAYVLRHWDFFRDHPLDSLYLWQGGFEPVAGLLMLALVGWALIRRHGWPWPLVAAPLAAGVMTWGVLSWLLLAVEKGTEQFLPDITLETLAGTPVSLAGYQGQPLVINLWASWCGPCRAEMPVLALTESQRSDVRFLYVNQGEDVPTIDDFIADTGFEGEHVFSDAFSETSRVMNTRGLPTTFFFNADGRLVTRYTGQLSYPLLQDFLRRVE